MIGVRIQCDRDGCERHFEAGGHELRPRAGLRIGPPGAQRDAIVFTEPFVLLPEGWAAVGPDGAAQTYCADHRPA